MYKCGFFKHKENINKQEPLPKKEQNIVLYKKHLNTVYSGTHEIYLERISIGSSRNNSPRHSSYNEVMLQSYNNGTTIKIIDIQENDINVDHLYNFNTLNRMQIKIIDPDSTEYAADCLVYAYEYINFLKDYNIKYPYQELYVLYNAKNLENAFWNGYYLTLGNGSQDSYAFVSPALVGHELSHSLIQVSINLEYYKESGALNEAYADIFGIMFEKYLFEKHSSFGYELGSELFKDNHSLRSFIDPNKCGQPKSINDPLFYKGSEDNGGVHINSGVINHLFYRMSQKQDKKITFDIFLKVFFKLKSNSNFSDFKRILLSYVTDSNIIDIIKEQC